MLSYQDVLQITSYSAAQPVTNLLIAWQLRIAVVDQDILEMANTAAPKVFVCYVSII